jgi:hypothetical protein
MSPSGRRSRRDQPPQAYWCRRASSRSTLTDVPVVPAGEVAVIDVEEVTTTPVPALAPKKTVEPLTNPVPVMVTEVPALPVVCPLGLIDVTVGAP